MLTNTLIGPVFAIFLLGLHIRRMNSNCALVTLLSGLSFGLFVFYSHFQDSDTFLSFGVGVDDCLDFFCFKRPKYCNSENKTINGNSTILKRSFYRYPFRLNYELFKYFSFMYDGWLITLFTIFVGLFLSIFFKEPDKNPQELEECLATYMRKPSDQTKQDDTEYVISESENDELKEEKEEENKNEDKKELEDLSYLKKAIDEIIKLH